MKRTLLTYEEALRVVENNDTFYENISNILGYKISIFNYRFSQYSDFIEPIKGENLTSEEMRGLTFIFNKDGSLFKRYLMLTKFFNVNQVVETFYNNIKDKKIINVMNKEDGSLISFVKFPNGKILARSKASFISEQAVVANELYTSSINLQKVVDWGFNNDIVLFFEYVSPTNRIVLKYSESELVLLKARNNTTGVYIGIDTIDTFGIKTANFENHLTLDDMMLLSETIKDKEGWVIQFDDDLMVKQKGAWYFINHKLIESINHENDIIRLIIEEKIDDILSQLDVTDNDTRDYIAEINGKINIYLKETISSIEKLLLNFNGDINDFGRNYNKADYFGLAIHVARGKDIRDVVCEYIINTTKHLEKARMWLNKIT